MDLDLPKEKWEKQGDGRGPKDLSPGDLSTSKSWYLSTSKSGDRDPSWDRGIVLL